MMLAIIGGEPERFAPYVELYHQDARAARQAVAAGRRPFAGLRRRHRRAGERRALAARSKSCAIESEPSAAGVRSRRAEFDQEADRGSLYCGSPETVARKIAATAKTLGIARFDMKYSAGTLSHEKLMRCIELYGSKVIPKARQILAEAGH